MATQIRIELLKTSKNKDKASIEGFLYTLNRSSPKLSHWVCERRGTCNARLTTIAGVVKQLPSISDIHASHTHCPDPARADIIKGITRMKERATNSEDTTRSILITGIQTMNDSSISMLPKFESVKRTIRRKKSSTERFDIAKVAEEIIIPEKYKLSLKGQQFLLYDSGIGDINRLIVFGTSQMLSLLRETTSWFADGTFKAVPNQFYQLYTIHCEKDGYIIPCIYALMTNKSEAAYNILFRKLKEIEPCLHPTRIMVDFERAAFTAMEENFLSVISGCFFHLSQNVYRQIQAKGLTSQYLQDEDFALKMRMLPSLAFVPEYDVVDCFTILMGDFPESAADIAEYFETNYIGKRLPDQSRRTPPFPIRIWNMYIRVISKLARTNNSIEGWHNAFNSGLNCPHPNFIKLLAYLQREQSLQEANLVKWEAGEKSKISKLSETRNERILTLVEGYYSRETLAYLRGIAYNFQF